MREFCSLKMGSTGLSEVRLARLLILALRLRDIPFPPRIFFLFLSRKLSVSPQPDDDLSRGVRFLKDDVGVSFAHGRASFAHGQAFCRTHTSPRIGGGDVVKCRPPSYGHDSNMRASRYAGTSHETAVQLAVRIETTARLLAPLLAGCGA